VIEIDRELRCREVSESLGTTLIAGSETTRGMGAALGGLVGHPKLPISPKNNPYRMRDRVHIVTFDSTNAGRYYGVSVIKSFRGKDAEIIWMREYSKRIPGDIQDRALMKLQQLNAAEVLKDLAIPASNQLELLRGDRKGQFSIRINKQWRICFIWKAGHASDVEITDYH